MSYPSLSKIKIGESSRDPSEAGKVATSHPSIA